MALSLLLYSRLYTDKNTSCRLTHIQLPQDICHTAGNMLCVNSELNIPPQKSVKYQTTKFTTWSTVYCGMYNSFTKWLDLGFQDFAQFSLHALANILRE